MKADRLKQLKKELTVYEGFRGKPYLCTSGKLTVGIGRNLEDRGLTLEEAEYLLDSDIQECLGAVRAHLPWSEMAPEICCEVLVHMCFNLGIKGLLGFRQTLAAMESGEWARAAKEMKNSRWAKQVGKRSDQLAEKIESLQNRPAEMREVYSRIQKSLKALEVELEAICSGN